MAYLAPCPPRLQPRSRHSITIAFITTTTRLPMVIWERAASPRRTRSGRAQSFNRICQAACPHSLSPSHSSLQTTARLAHPFLLLPHSPIGYVTLRRHIPPPPPPKKKLFPLSVGETCTPSNTPFLEPTLSTTPNGSSITSAIFAQYTAVTNGQTDRQMDHRTRPVPTGRFLLLISYQSDAV